MSKILELIDSVDDLVEVNSSLFGTLQVSHDGVILIRGIAAKSLGHRDTTKALRIEHIPKRWLHDCDSLYVPSISGSGAPHERDRFAYLDKEDAVGCSGRLHILIQRTAEWTPGAAYRELSCVVGNEFRLTVSYSATAVRMLLTLRRFEVTLEMADLRPLCDSLDGGLRKLVELEL